MRRFRSDAAPLKAVTGDRSLMKLVTPTALVLVAALAAAPAAAQYGAQSAPMRNTPEPSEKPETQVSTSKGPAVKPSGKALKAIAELQQAVKANDVANIPAKVAAAQAVAQTKEDRYLIGLLEREAAIAANDNVALAQAVDAIASANLLDATLTAALYLDLGAKQYNAKQYQQAVASFQHAVQLTPNDPQATNLLAQGMAAAGQGGDAAGTFQKAIAAQVAAGQKPDETLYREAVSAAYSAKSPAAIQLSRDWVAAYPSPDSWRNAIAIYRNQSQQDVEGTIDLLRLMQATGAMTTAGDYSLYISAASEQSNFNEAQTALNAGIAAKLVDPASPAFRDTVSALKTKPIATAADLETAHKTAQNGAALLRIGDRYYGMGNYAKAAELYRAASGKSGVDPNIANLHLGMALARAGDKAGATTAFNAVTGPRAEIAKYWLIYVGKMA
jgi:tetratricopeptide (TPR) repeat protein